MRIVGYETKNGNFTDGRTRETYFKVNWIWPKNVFHSKSRTAILHARFGIPPIADLFWRLYEI